MFLRGWQSLFVIKLILMKKLAWSLIIAGAFIGWGYWLYPRFFQSPDQDVWDLIPENALAVYESNQVVRVWNKVNRLDFWKNLSAIPFFTNLNREILELDSLAGSAGRLDEILTGRPFLISFHVVAKDELGYLMFIPFDQANSAATLEGILSQLNNRQETRIYQGYQITEVEINADRVFAYFKASDYLVGSFTAVLVEDALRKAANRSDLGFRDFNPKIFQLARLENDQGNIYVNTRRLPQLLSIYGFGSDLPEFGESSFLDVSLGVNQALFTGFTTTDGQDDEQFLNVFEGVPPVEMKMENLIPNRAALLLHLTFGNPHKFKENLFRYLKEVDPNHNQRIDSIDQTFEVELGDMFDWFGSEIGLVTLESINLQKPGKLLFIRTSDQGESLNQLNRLAESISLQMQDSLYRETFGQVPITQLYLADFPKILLGTQFDGFESCFYAPVEGYIVFGNSIESIKILINDVNLENTWGKSVAQISYLESILQESNLSLIANTRNHWKSWLSKLRPAWSEFFQRNRAVFRDYDQLALQFGLVDDKYYTSLDVHFNPSSTELGGTEKLIVAQDTHLDTTLISKPFVVRSHLDRSFETLVQDAKYHLIFLSSEGSQVWENPLPGPMLEAMFQIDFFQNGRLQYLFATDHALHIVDRNGHNIDQYPLQLGPDITIDKINVIDYDQSGNYRFLVSDLKGNVYMFNKEQQNLEEWNGLKMGHPLSSPPFHIRVRNRDCLILGLENGVIHVLTRRGETFDGFPLDFQSPIDNPLFVDIGSSFSNTIFSTITEDGEMVKFNLNGEIGNRIQFYKPSQEVVFQLIPDALNRTFVIARQELNRLSILDRRGQLIFEKDYLTARRLTVQFYSFGSDNQFYAVTDRDQEVTYLYDRVGNLINYQPVESAHRIAMLKRGSDHYQVYGSYQNRVTIYDFKH